MAKKTKYVYFFGNGRAEGRGDEKTLLGGKGAGLAEMTHIGLPVPAGFTITTQCCAEYFRTSRRWPAGVDAQVRKALARMERVCKRKFGHARDPLLVSVRSGAALSMPGMMESILNLGLNDESIDGLARATGNRRFALDAYRRLIMMYGATARGIDRARFDDAFDQIKNEGTRSRLGISADASVNDTDMNEEELDAVVERFKGIYAEGAGEPFLQEPYEQLVGAINAVFGSWMAPKALTYRRVEKITGLDGTAVNICQMVFGNLGNDSGTGVCFTRDPSTGHNELYGDLLINAQGEDVVAGIRNTLKISELQHLMPEVWSQLLAVRAILELHYGEMQDLEFTIERGRLYMLQCRTGKRSATAAFKIAVDQATKPLLSADETRRLVKLKHLPRRYATRAAKPAISKDTAILRMTERDIEQLFFPVIDPTIPHTEREARRLGRGINAVPGAASGRVVFRPADAERACAQGESTILVRRETSPEDVGGMYAAAGILTATGGKTSHAAVVARSWGKCCIVGCEAMHVDEQGNTLTLNGRTLHGGDVITLDGSAGDIYDGAMDLITPQAPPEYDTLLKWCDERRRMKVRANADTPGDALKAVEHGAEGIGLCRTEHMFFETAERRLAMQEMIVADDATARRRALDRLQPFQKDDFLEIFRVMDGRPVTIRLLDPPLHEFLPRNEEEFQKLSRHTGIAPEAIRRRAAQLHESNPMLGHRGCRLCITFPEILEMQVSAILEAAIEAKREGVAVAPEIMIPLTIDATELRILAEQTRAVADAILDEAGMELRYSIGTMIETPRAALLSDRLARVCDFFSFGTNDLTQTTLALSRDDSGRFLPEYCDANKAAIFTDDPFQSLDQDGVGMLMEWSMARGRQARPRLKVGICGEHGGDPKSVRFCHGLGFDYVSCSPFRVPVARLAAAQATIAERLERAAARKPKQTAGARAKRSASKPTARRSAKRTTKRPKRKTSASQKESPATARAKRTKPSAGKTAKTKALRKGKRAGRKKRR